MPSRWPNCAGAGHPTMWWKLPSLPLPRRLIAETLLAISGSFSRGADVAVAEQISAVDSYLDALQHARKAEIDTLRRLILSAVPGLVERIKWNAPSFGLGDDDRLTMRLHPGDRLQLILHRGARA